jgi:hypothetical protein
MKLGSLNISNLKFGVNQVNKVFLGSDLVWQAFDSDYQAILDYAISQGYTLPSAGQQSLQNQLLLDLKSAGVWSKLDTFSVFATDGDSDFALIDWKRLTQYTAVNSPTFTVNEGFKGNGTSAYIDTNFNPTIGTNNYTLNDASRYYYHKSGTLSAVIESNSSGANAIRNTGISQLINGTAFINSNFNYTSSQGFKSIHRTSSNDLVLANEKTTANRTGSSSSLASANQFILRRSSLYSNTQVSMYAMGASLVVENDFFVDAINNYIDSL